EIWRFSRGNNSWEFIGNTDFESQKYDLEISYERDHIFMNLYKDEVYLVDIHNNYLKTFSKKSIHRSIIPIYKSFFLDDKFYLFVWKSTSSKVVQVVPVNEEIFFGELISSNPFYYNNKKIIYFFSFLSF